MDKDWVKTIAPGVRLIGRAPPFAELGIVDSVIAMPDGKRLMVTCDKRLCVCEIETEQILWQRRLTNARSMKIFASPDKRRFVWVNEFNLPVEDDQPGFGGQSVAGTKLGRVELICLNGEFAETGSLVMDSKDFPEGEVTGVSSISFSPNGRLFAAMAGAVLTVADSETGNSVLNLRNFGLVQSCAFSPDDEQLYLFGEKPLAIDIESGETIRNSGFTSKFSGNSYQQWCPSPDGQVALASVFRRIDLVNAKTGEKISGLGSDSSFSAAAPKFSSDGKVACSVVNDTANKDGGIVGVFWNVADGKEIGRVNVERMTWDYDCSADGQSIVIPNTGVYGVRFFSRNTELQQSPGRKDFLPAAYGLAFNTNGTRIAMSCFPKMRIIGVQDGSFETVDCYGHSPYANPTDERFVAVSFDFLSSVIDVVDGEKLTVQKRAAIDAGREFDVVRGLLAVGGANSEGVAKLFLDFPLDTVFSADGKQVRGLFHQGKRGIVLRTWSDDQTPKTNLLVSMDRVSVTPNQVSQMDGIVPHGRIAPDGSWIAYFRIGEVFLIDTKTKEELHKISIDTEVSGLRISGDGKLLAVVSPKQIGIWDAKSGELLKTLEAESGRVAFSARSPRMLIVPGNDDGAARVVDTDSWNSVREFNSKAGNRNAAAISADGRQVVIGLADGRLEHWWLELMD